MEQLGDANRLRVWAGNLDNLSKLPTLEKALESRCKPSSMK